MSVSRSCRRISLQGFGVFLSVAVAVLFMSSCAASVSYLQVSVETEEDCQVTAIRSTGAKDTCFSDWNQNATRTHCCSVTTADTSLMAVGGANGTATECCEDECPVGTNHTLDTVFLCQYQQQKRNITINCCQTRCCGLFENRKQEEKNRSINQAWLIFLCSVVALSGVIAVGFTLYICITRNMLSLREVLRTWRGNQQLTNARTLLRQDSSHEVIVDTPTLKIRSMFVNWDGLGDQSKQENTLSGTAGEPQHGQANHLRSLFQEKPE